MGEEEREGVLSVQETAAHLPPLPMEVRRRLAEMYGERAALAYAEWRGRSVLGWVGPRCCHGNNIDCLMLGYILTYIVILTKNIRIH